ncbi:MAG TPA: hypothetical protein VFE05_16245 [Longimicrobiaceae bacterium]|nr:hypothetical protein [Longimicrobiaceae bacterium]
MPIRFKPLASALAAAFFVSGCCGSDLGERVRSTGSATVELDGARSEIVLTGQADADALGDVTFRDLRDALRGGSPYATVMVSGRTGTEPALRFVLALPTPLRAGTTIPVTGAFIFVQDASGAEPWGFIDFPGEGAARVSIAMPGFDAVRASGSVVITNVTAAGVEMRVDVTAQNEAGRTVHFVSGFFGVAVETTGQTC